MALLTTEADAYALGLKDGARAAEKGEALGSGLSWLHDQDFNEAYDKGVNAAQKAFVLARYPNAYSMLSSDTGLWQVWQDLGVWFPFPPLAEAAYEYEAWQDAAVSIGAAARG